jgi:hypothetical protein
MSKHPLIGLLLATIASASIASASIAALPPKYLAIKDFKQCLAVQQFSTYRAWCLPAQQPASCPATSWQELKALAGNDRVPDCPAAADRPPPEPAQSPGGK